MILRELVQGREISFQRTCYPAFIPSFRIETCRKRSYLTLEKTLEEGINKALLILSKSQSRDFKVSLEVQKRDAIRFYKVLKPLDKRIRCQLNLDLKRIKEIK